jgi:hypothetical protein
MNDASSRSHAIFTISLEIYESQVCLEDRSSRSHLPLDHREEGT